MRSNTTLPSVATVAMPDEEDGDQEDSAAERASWSRERTIAETLAAKLILQWQGPISTLSRAGKAFEGLEALLGGAQGGGFDLGVGPFPACNSLYLYVCGACSGGMSVCVCKPCMCIKLLEPCSIAAVLMYMRSNAARCPPVCSSRDIKASARSMNLETHMTVQAHFLEPVEASDQLLQQGKKSSQYCRNSWLVG